MPGAIIPYRSAPQPPSPPGVRGRWFASAGGLPAAGHLVTHQDHCWWYHIPILVQNLKRPEGTTKWCCYKFSKNAGRQKKGTHIQFKSSSASNKIPTWPRAIRCKSTSSVPFYKFWGSYSCLLKSSCHTLSSAIARPFKFGASWESRPSRSRSRSPTWSSC